MLDTGYQASSIEHQAFNNVFIHSSPWPIIFHPFFIVKKGVEIYKKEKFDLFTVHSYPPFYNDIGGRWLYGRLKRVLSSGCPHEDTRRRPSESPRSVSPSLSLPSATNHARSAYEESILEGKPSPKEVPYILEIMHITGYPRAGNFKERFYKILTKLFIRFFAKKAKAIRVINQNQVPEFLKESGVNEKKIKYTPAFYIDFDIFKPQNLEKKYDIVFSGRLVKNKGIFLLLKTIKKLKVKSQKLKVIIIGSGPLRPKIEKYVRKNNLQDNVQFAGWLPSIEDVEKIYNQARIMVMPSFNEGGPRVCLEAMACKVPVITTKVGLMIDIIKNKENGLFIDWKAEDIAEKIMLLLTDENLRNKIAENGYQTVQQFERKKTIRQYAIQYQKLINNSNL